jgi:hypothetical protein
MKEKLERIQLADEDQFFESLYELLRDIDQEELNACFRLGCGKFSLSIYQLT